jgi:hypothetical protein
MDLIEKWIAELRALERLQSMTSPGYTMYRIRQAEIELIKKFIQSLKENK